MTRPAPCRLMCLAIAATVLHACGGSSPAAPSSPRFQVTFTSQAPDRCSGPCLRLAWVDSGAVAQRLLKIAVQVQNIPTRGISSASLSLHRVLEGIGE